MSIEDGLKPRNYINLGETLAHDYAVFFRDHPEAFDAVFWPALETERDETVSLDPPAATRLDRDEHRQMFGDPVVGRAYIVPSDSLLFQAVDSGRYEAFGAPSESLQIVCSEPGLRTMSLIQWREHAALDPDVIETRTVFIADSRPVGRTLGGALFVHVCWPLPAAGEIPEEPEATEEPEAEPGDGGSGVGVI